jgi:hypothetical protein
MMSMPPKTVICGDGTKRITAAVLLVEKLQRVEREYRRNLESMVPSEGLSIEKIFCMPLLAASPSYHPFW